MKIDNSIVFGDTYKDAITDFEGVATGFCTYITGCDQVLLKPKVDEKGMSRDGQWLDIDRLTHVSVDTVELPRQLGQNFNEEFEFNPNDAASKELQRRREAESRRVRNLGADQTPPENPNRG